MEKVSRAAGTAFVLDTSGEVGLSIAEGVPFEIAGGHRWSDLTPFTQGYVEALFADSTAHGGRMERADSKPGFRRFSSKRPAFSDLAPETLARIIADCEAACARYPDHERRSQADSAGAGAGFWEGRNTGWPEGYTRDGFPPLTVQLGDDGKVRFAKATGEGAR